MDYLFIDTNVFEDLSFHIGEILKNINERVQKGEITILSSSILLHEIKYRYDKIYTDCLNVLKTPASNKKIGNFFSKHKTGMPVDLIDHNIENFIETIFEKSDDLDEFLSKVSLKDLVNDYRTYQIPFTPQKPTEFSDAIMLQCLLKFSKNKKSYVYIISNDNGFKSFCENKDLLVHYKTLEDYLNEENRKVDGAKKCDLAFDKAVKDEEFLSGSYFDGVFVQPNKPYYSYQSFDVDEISFEKVLNKKLVSINAKECTYQVIGSYEVTAFHNLSIVGKDFYGEPDIIAGLSGMYSHHCILTFFITISIPEGNIEGVGWDETIDLNPISAFPISEEYGNLKSFQCYLGNGKINLFGYENPLQRTYLIDEDNPFRLEP